MIKIITALDPKAIEPAIDFSKNSLLGIPFPIKAAKQSETAKIPKAQIAIILGHITKVIKSLKDKYVKMYNDYDKMGYIPQNVIY